MGLPTTCCRSAIQGVPGYLRSDNSPEFISKRPRRVIAGKTLPWPPCHECSRFRKNSARCKWCRGAANASRRRHIFADRAGINILPSKAIVHGSVEKICSRLTEGSLEKVEAIPKQLLTQTRCKLTIFSTVLPMVRITRVICHHNGLQIPEPLNHKCDAPN